MLPADCYQLLLSLMPDWAASAGQLWAFERAALADDWRPAAGFGAAIRTQSGRNGLAWGRGLALDIAMDGRFKREGDGCAPAGLFRLSSAFGIAPTNEGKALTRLPYQQARPTLKWVDDPASRFYNRMVEVDMASLSASPDWCSAEDLLREDERYRWAIVVDHNVSPLALPGAGSAIFLHLWQDSATPTAGCTAMAQADIERLLSWLNPAAAPLLLQLPQAVFQQHRIATGWPEMYEIRRNSL